MLVNPRLVLITLAVLPMALAAQNALTTAAPIKPTQVRETTAGPARGMTCLLKAYPDLVKEILDSNHLRTHAGDVLAYDQGLPQGSHEWRLDHADLKAQFEQPYPAQPLTAAPDLNRDPGRLRAQVFFDHLYGQNLPQVKSQLVSVYWAPCQCKISFAGRHGAAQALVRVGQQLAKRPELAAYVAKPLGSLNWRNIAGTNRRSMHAYGAAIDFQLPKHLHHYWQWSGCKAGARCHYPEPVLRDQTLQAVVQVFEAEGFIWGGKWYHFDTVHFEYRPELTGPACAGLR